jgi:hypothetical protein
MIDLNPSYENRLIVNDKIIYKGRIYRNRNRKVND